MKIKDMAYEDYIKEINKLDNNTRILVLERHMNSMYVPDNIVKYARRYNEAKRKSKDKDRIHKWN